MRRNVILVLKVWAFDEVCFNWRNSCFVMKLRVFGLFSRACLEPNSVEGEKNAILAGLLCVCESESYNVKK